MLTLELPEVSGPWTVEDVEKGGIPEYWIVDRHPDDDRDALVHIHRLIRVARVVSTGSTGRSRCPSWSWSSRG